MVLNRAAKVVKYSEVETVFQPCFRAVHTVVTGNYERLFLGDQPQEYN